MKLTNDEMRQCWREAKPKAKCKALQNASTEAAMAKSIALVQYNMNDLEAFFMAMSEYDVELAFHQVWIDEMEDRWGDDWRNDGNRNS